MSNGTYRVKEDDFVLKVSNSVDSTKWDESKYYNFLNELCKNRVYQKEAILTTLRLFCGGRYNSTRELAEENFNNNDNIRNIYGTLNNFIAKLHFSNSFSASIDLATATGKSWVIYGVAAIMLACNIVDQVLILVPSVTIEEELTKKIKLFATDSQLSSLLLGFIPKIINGSTTISKGCICVENRDAIYKNARTSICDSLANKGDRTLVISDEAHHIYYSEENEWKSFIEKISFKFILGLSGTCYYSNNVYFSDVIYRYSLKTAIAEDKVKMVEYVSESNVSSRAEDRWNVIINSHEYIKSQIPILPLTVVITANITSCDKVAKEFKTFLMNKYSLTELEATEKILVVHSKSSAVDKIRLKSIDDKDDKVEWIFSVSMLTEGWDVKRVFQIVPHEERAFNSKLLIAQVLGRGLRVPLMWNNSLYGKPKVIIFNHANWANSVKKLVDEVLEIEKKISNTIIEDSNYHFNLLNIIYSSNKTTKEIKMNGTYSLFERGYINLPTVSNIEKIETKFSDISVGNERVWNTSISHKTYSIDQIAMMMWNRFEDIPDDNNEGLTKKYQNEWTVNKLKQMIQLSLEKSGNTMITEIIKQKFLAALGVCFRQGNLVVDYNFLPDEYETVSTNCLRKETVSGSALLREKVLFWSENTKKYLSADEKEFFGEIIDTTNQYRQYKIVNNYCFKTPQSFVVADSDPEKLFLKKLTSCNLPLLNSWIKSNNVGFYSIEYSWRKGEHPQRGSFNPDFFIYCNNKIIVAEIKDDEQVFSPDEENVGKYKYAKAHFKIINDYLNSKGIDLKYVFTMISPKSYDVFFEKLETDEIDNFVSMLDNSIENILDKKLFVKK